MPAFGATKLVARILNIYSEFEKFPGKNTYKSGSLAK
jgi:hypothetical protein